jgi:mRNA interferase YafQ
MILAPKPRFQKALRQLVKKNPQLRDKIQGVLNLLEQDFHNPSLRTHKLNGKMKEYWSCSVASNCRIIFSFDRDLETGEILLVLSDIGNHDVYD